MFGGQLEVTLWLRAVQLRDFVVVAVAVVVVVVGVVIVGGVVVA